MEITKVLESFGLKVVDLDKMTDEEIQAMIDDKINQDKEHITKLESEKESLSQSKEELTSSEAGLKERVANLEAELATTKENLSKTTGKLEQITGMYKEQFIQDPNEKVTDSKKLDEVSSDVMQLLINSK